MRHYSTFSKAYQGLVENFLDWNEEIQPDFWQALDVKSNPAARMREMTGVTFQTLLPSTALEHYREDIRPNLPWADEHFLIERVSGKPINPGTTWKIWPWAKSADKHRTHREQFSHSYAERYWPKYANLSPTDSIPHQGIRFEYGDLNDLIALFIRDPQTRQAYLPVWFPEDTGAVHGERVPCTLGYHFWRRNNTLNVFYPIRSCDIVRHLRDDWYLTVRLLLWILSQLQETDITYWGKVKPGLFQFWAGSFHCFVNDLPILKKEHENSQT